MDVVWTIVRALGRFCAWGADHPMKMVGVLVALGLASLHAIGASLRRSSWETIARAAGLGLALAGLVWLLRRPKGRQRRRIVSAIPWAVGVFLVLVVIGSGTMGRLSVGIPVAAVLGIAWVFKLDSVTHGGSRSFVDATMEWLDLRDATRVVRKGTGQDVHVTALERSEDRTVMHVRVEAGSDPSAVASDATSIGAALADAGVPTAPGRVVVVPGGSASEVVVVADAKPPTWVRIPNFLPLDLDG